MTPNVRANRTPTVGRQARAGENVPRTASPGLVARLAVGSRAAVAINEYAVDSASVLACQRSEIEDMLAQHWQVAEVEPINREPPVDAAFKISVCS